MNAPFPNSVLNLISGGIYPWQNFTDSAIFRDNFSSNGWISMKLCSCNVVRAWTLPFGFGPDICSYCNFRDNLSSNGWISMQLCSCNVVRAWMLPFGFGPDICSYLPLAIFHRFCNFHHNSILPPFIGVSPI